MFGNTKIYIAVAKTKEKEKIIISSEGFSGEKVVSTLNAVANVTMRKPAGGLNTIQKSVLDQKIKNETSVPFISSLSNQ